jgi:nicotinamide riboside transporter PnuC
MSKRGYELIGWLVWKTRRRHVKNAKNAIAKRRTKVGAAGVIALVLLGGVVVAAKSGNGDD